MSDRRRIWPSSADTAGAILRDLPESDAACSPLLFPGGREVLSPEKREALRLFLQALRDMPERPQLRGEERSDIERCAKALYWTALAYGEARSRVTGVTS